MSSSLRLLLLVFSLIWFFVISYLLKKDKIPVKYSLVWFFSAFIILLVALVPTFVNKVTTLLGFQTTSNMIIGVLLCLLLFITVVLTIIVSGQRKKITLLIQEVSMLKNGDK